MIEEGMGQEIRLHLAGPDRFCPTCGRWLVRIHDDGSYDIAGQSGNSLAVNMEAPEWDEDGRLMAYVMEAFCLRRWCRLRSWIHARLGT